MKAVVDAAVEKAYGGARQIHWMEIYAGEKATRLYGSDVWLPDETLEAARELLGLDQGADDDARRRRHPLAQRRAAPAARPLRLPAPGAPLPRRAEPAQGPVEDRHGHLPREHRGHLRGHRVGGRDGRRAEGDRVPPGRDGRDARSASPRRRRSGSSRSRARAPSGSSARRSEYALDERARRRSRSCTRATS